VILGHFLLAVFVAVFGFETPQTPQTPQKAT
jgi:hypothetical protein